MTTGEAGVGSADRNTAPRGRSRAFAAVAVALIMAVTAACGGGGGSDDAGSDGSSGSTDKGGPPVTAGPATASKQQSTPTLVPPGAAFAAGTVTKGRWLIAGNHAESLVAGKGMDLASATAKGHGVTAKVRQASDQVGLAIRVKDSKNLWFLTPVPRYGAWRVGILLDGKIAKFWAIKLVGAKQGTDAALISKGNTVTVVVGGRVRLSVTSADLAEQTGVGVIALSPSTGGWTDISVEP